MKTATRGLLLKKGVLKNSTKFSGKQTLESLRPATLLKKRLWHRCSLVNFVKFSRTPLLQNPSPVYTLYPFHTKLLLLSFREYTMERDILFLQNDLHIQILNS